MRLYYLGPKGTFSYLAAKTYLSEEEVTYSPKSNLYEVIKAVNSHSDAVGIVPIENSIEGTINIVADALAQEDIYAHGEIHLDINFGLYANKDTHIQDYPHNVTRFLVVKSNEHYNESASSTLLLITPKHDKVGLLASILNTFALFDINLSWIESRPLKTQLGMYRFFVQTDIGKNEKLNKVITILQTLDFEVKIIGAFNHH